MDGSPKRTRRSNRSIVLLLLVAGVSCKEAVPPSPPVSGVGGLTLLFRAGVEGAGDAFAPATDGARLYADVATRIQAFNLDNGSLVWSYDRPQGGPSALVARAGRVFFAGAAAIALDAATGRELWRFTPDSFAGFCESDGDGDAFYFGTEQHRVYALRASDGALLWSRDLGPDWPYAGVVRGMTVSGDTVYAVVEHDTGINHHIGVGEIFALNRKTGEVYWQYSNGDGTALTIFQSAARISGSHLLASANWENAFVAIDRFTGREVWRHVGDPGYFGPQEAPETENGIAYGTSEDQRATAIQVATGEVLWRTRLPSGTKYAALCGNRLLVNHYGLTVLNRSGQVLGTGYNGHDYVRTDFVTVGRRAYVFSTTELLAFECPG